jgi:hypothetical protein
MTATRRLRLLGCLVLALSLLAEAVATAEVWRSPVHDWTLFQIEKPLTNPGLDLESAGAAAVARFRPLPPEVLAAFGAQAVDYESVLRTT